MAANEYYNTSTSYSPHNAHGDPSVPQQTGTIGGQGNPSQQSISPVSSPFDDHRYEYAPGSSQQHLASGGAGPGYGGQGIAYNDTAYHGASSPPGQYDPPLAGPYNNDPFADQNAIPLQNHGKMGEHGHGYGADPEARYATGGGMYVPDKRRKKGWFSGRITWVVYILTTVQIGVFIGELVRNGVLTGSPIQTKPQFNIMIGPSANVLINMGARWQPCMHNVRNVTDYTSPIAWPCPNTTTTNPDDAQCSLSELCGMGGVPAQTPGTPIDDHSHEPNQWWRFITPIFLHAGIIHIGFNMLLQLTLGRDMEKEIGPIRFTLVYFAAGIFGFVFGGNYASPTLPSVGASGSLFGILALVMLDLLYNWGTRRSPVKDLLFLLLDIALAFVLGLLPGLDNFSHIGGFIMGLVLGICLMHSPQVLRERIGVDEPPYATVEHAPNSGAPGIAKFVKQPIGFFKGRKPFWWAWWLVRAGALVAVFIGFILLLRNFYDWQNECTWCHRLSCLPIRDWCDTGFKFIERNDPEQGAKMVRDILGGVPLDFAPMAGRTGSL